MTFFLSEQSVTLTSAAISLLASVAMTSARSSAMPIAVFVPAGEIADTLRELSAIYADHEPVRVVDSGAYHAGVFVVERPTREAEAPPAVDGVIHVMGGLQLDHVASIIRILSGEGTMVAGGSLVDGHRIAGDDPDLPMIGQGKRGEFIRGGEPRHVAAGDLVVVPAGVAHGFGPPDQRLTYMAIRIDTTKVLPFKNSRAV